MAYRVAMIGCGGRGRAHAPAVKHDPRCHVVALADVRQEAMDAMNSDFGLGARTYTDHRAMLEAERPEVVVASLWTRLHLPVLEDCIAAGVRAVHSEKPMAPTWGECQTMVRRAEEAGVQLTFSHQRRFAEGNQLARRMLDEGIFGSIERMELFSPPNLLDCGTHTFDQALSFNHEIGAKWVLGAVDASSLLNWFDVQAEIMSVGTIVFQNGVRASYQIGGPDMEIWGGVRVTGSRGFFEVFWDGEFRRAQVYDDPGFAVPSVAPDTDGQMVRMMAEVLDCLVAGAESQVSARRALRAAEIIFAAYESVRKRTRIETPLTGFEDSPFLSMVASGELGPRIA